MDRLAKIKKNECDNKTNKATSSLNEIDDDLKVYLTSLDSSTEPLDELAIAEKIKEILTKNNKTIAGEFDRVEYITFYFWPNDGEEAIKQGRYYFPMMSGTQADGQVMEFPDAKYVNTETIEYWKGRATESKHPFLVSRYADLAVDFGQRINGSFDYLMVQKVIDSTINLCIHKLDDGLGCKQKLKRALALAKLINDENRQKQVQQAIIDTEPLFAEDGKPGLWGYGFNWLLIDQSQEKLLNDSQKKLLVENLEQRLARLIAPDNPDSWNVECAVLLLAKYYEVSNDEVKLQSSLEQLESACRKNIYANSDGLLILNYLEKLSEIYKQYSQHQFAKDAVQRIKSEMGNLGQNKKFDFHKISVDMEIKKDEIDAILDAIFGKGRKRELGKIRNRLAATFIPRKDKVQKELNEIASKYVYLRLGNHSIISEDGFSVAKYGSVDEDIDRHLLNHFSQNLHFQAAFLHLALEELIKIKTPEKLYKVIAESPVFRVEDKGYILRVLNDYWKHDYLSCSCLMIPLIEDAVRGIYRLCNIPFIKINDDGGYDVQSLNVLLEMGVISKVFGAIGENLEFYLRVLLTERIGWNLRNNYAHGVNKNIFASMDVADRLLHVLLCLSLVRKK